MEITEEKKTPKYKPAVWNRTDNDDILMTPGTYGRLPYIKTLEEVDFVVAGIPFDTLTSNRPGTRFGPKAIREAYGGVGYTEGIGIEAFDYVSGVDYGDFKVINGDTKRTFEKITEEMTEILKAGVIPVILGGDHAITYAELLAYKEVYGPVSLIHFDSHTDTWGGEESLDFPSHGNPFRNAILTGCINPETSIQVGMRGMMKDEKDYEFAHSHGLEQIFATDIHKMGVYKTAERMREKVKGTKVMVTFDIDFVDPSVAPGTGTPVPGGFNAWETLELVRTALTGLDIVGFDMVEVAPNYDPMENTQLLANKIVGEFINIIAAKKANITEYKYLEKK
ncbi:agmatinase [Anaerosporobacter sp.]|uniref:agmatinase n=1 Tax=Anaerosporobacter sp. TaxID=1872529 RepID=UPI00286ED303|nr:agmatinase [Anaerosporobacter sp.]